ncbi:transposase IS4 family protein [Salmonella enterica subsp. salamae]|nr:transposase IS4 family protein [Salmonella enterica subsp. salamae]
MLTQKLSLCVIAVDWSGYPSQEYHVLRASLLCDGRSLPLLSWIVPSEKQQSSQIQKAFLDALAGPVNPKARVISYLTLGENILRHSPLILRRTVLSTVLNHFARTYRSMVLVY